LKPEWIWSARTRLLNTYRVQKLVSYESGRPVEKARI
jgi:hypothetical protein